MNTLYEDSQTKLPDDGIPKKKIDTEEEKMPMDNIVNLDEFTQMGDEEDHEVV